MKNDLSGSVYGRLTVLERAPNSLDGRKVWKCKCECGNTRNIQARSLEKGITKSCGCISIENLIRRNTRHGHNGRLRRSRTYEVWASMWQRCSNQKHKHFKYYGGRGIQVCEEWMRFENFLAEMGERPEGLTLDRRDVDGNYEKDNCRWVEWTVQVENRRRKKHEVLDENPHKITPMALQQGDQGYDDQGAGLCDW